MDEDKLTRLRTLAQYREGRETVFPSRTSLDWAIRVHRRELIQCGALLLVGGRRMVDPPLFDEVVLARAQRAMAAELSA